MPTHFITVTAHNTVVLNIGVLSDLLGKGVEVWRGSECERCQRRNVCPDPIV